MARLPSPSPQVRERGSSGHSSRKDLLEGFLLESSCREAPAVENVAASTRGLSLDGFRSAPRHNGKAGVHNLNKPTQQTAQGPFLQGFHPRSTSQCSWREQGKVHLIFGPVSLKSALTVVNLSLNLTEDRATRVGKMTTGTLTT